MTCLAAARPVAALALLLSVAALSGGCSSVASSAAASMATGLSTAILNQEDPEQVREALPAYLVLLDGLAADPDAEPAVLDAAARLYAANAVVFLSDPERARSSARRAALYGRRSLCQSDAMACDLDGTSFDEFSERLAALKPRSAEALYSYGIGSLAYIRTHSDDLQAIAALPRVERSLERLLEIGPGDYAGSVNGYLGMLNTLRPPALGGKPDIGRRYFEKALALTGGRDLGIKVEYARGYARLVYDRELHDQLLREVLAADVHAEGLTMLNQLAVIQARDLLADADNYF